MSAFRKATKERAFARLALAGPSGSGKTYSALAIATHLTDAPVALVDTEHGSASKYADLFAFDVLELEPPFHPDRFVQAIKDAADAGYGALVIDSLSHAWNGAGGLLEIVDQIAARGKQGANSFAAWKDATPIQQRLTESIVRAPLHIIATMRSKTEYVLDAVEKNGRTYSVPRKVGMAPVQRDGMEYEFDIFAELDTDHRLLVTKSRCPELADVVVEKPGQQVAATMRAWLGRGAEPTVRPAAPVPQAAEPTPAPPLATNGNGVRPFVCPRCAGAVFDNREDKAAGKKGPRMPDLKCRDAKCGWVVWMGSWRDDVLERVAGAIERGAIDAATAETMRLKAAELEPALLVRIGRAIDDANDALDKRVARAGDTADRDLFDGEAETVHAAYDG